MGFLFKNSIKVGINMKNCQPYPLIWLSNEISRLYFLNLENTSLMFVSHSIGKQCKFLKYNER